MVKKLFSLCIAALFAAAFGMGGLMAGVFPLIHTAKQVWAVQSWQVAQSTIKSVELDRRRGNRGGATFIVKANYSYVFAGREFSGTRVGLSDSTSSDNIGDWHQTWFNRLSEAKKTERSVAVWINPENPQQAVLDPNVRWPLVMFQLPFALLFTSVGLVAAFVFVSVLLNRPVLLGGLFASSRRRPVSDKTMAWVLSFAWCGLSFPFAALVWMTPGNWFAKTILSLFVLIGLLLLTGAVKSSLKR
jgi:Protein of unknown function (DUF3592)